ncbi:MAG: DUF433 domain-containing protein [bacterium]
MVTNQVDGDWIESDSEHLGGNPRVKNTRISVSLLLELLASGMTIEEITEEYPSLSHESIQGVLHELSDKQKAT